jgi:hypothetical protein
MGPAAIDGESTQGSAAMNSNGHFAIVASRSVGR